MKKVIAKIEDFDFSTREYLFIGAILLLIGLLIGIGISPKGDRTIGSNNGSNNASNNSGCSDNGLNGVE